MGTNQIPESSPIPECRTGYTFADRLYDQQPTGRYPSNGEETRPIRSEKALRRIVFTKKLIEQDTEGIAEAQETKKQFSTLVTFKWPFLRLSISSLN